MGRSPGPGPWPGAAPRQTDGSGRGGRIGEGGVRWCRPGRTPASAEEACWGPGPCASGGAACPLRRAGGRRGDTPSCHRRCPGLSRRTPAGRGGNARAGAAVSSQLLGARPGRQCACAAGAPRAGRAARGPALVTPPTRPNCPSRSPTGSHWLSHPPTWALTASVPWHLPGAAPAAQVSCSLSTQAGGKEGVGPYNDLR